MNNFVSRFYDIQHNILMLLEDEETVFWEHIDNIEKIEKEENFQDYDLYEGGYEAEVVIFVKTDNPERPREIFKIPLTFKVQCDNLIAMFMGKKQLLQMFREAKGVSGG